MSKRPNQDVIAIDARGEDLDRAPNSAITVSPGEDLVIRRRAATRAYVLLPIIYLAVTLAGGLRFAGSDNAFIFIKPPLVSLVFAAILIVLFMRAGVIELSGWFDEGYSTLQNVASGGILLTIFAASAQIFNSLLPANGLPLWIIGFCFFWTLWNNLFADFDSAKLFRSLAAMFGLAFVVKYLVLANLTTTGEASLLQRIFENPAKEAFTWLLDLPRYSAATGYAQFFALVLYLIGLFLTPRRMPE